MTLENKEIKNEEVKDNEKETQQEEKKEEKQELDPVEVLSKGMDEIFNEVEKEVKDEEKDDTESKAASRSEKVEDKEDDEEKQQDLEDSDSEKESDGEKKVEADDSQKDTEYETVPIPQDQVDIARQLGYPDKEIIELAQKSPDRLRRMVEMYSKPAESQRETKKVEEVKEEKRERLEHIVLDDLGDLDSDSAKVVEKLLKATNTIVDRANEQTDELERLGEQTSAITKKDQVSATAKIDTFFDGVSEHLPELGTNGSLTKDQAKTRTEVYGHAMILKETRGISQDKALEEAVYLYGLGKVDLDDLEKKAEDKVKEKLNKQKKKMSPRPGGKKRSEKQVKGKEAALEVLTQGLKEIYSN